MTVAHPVVVTGASGFIGMALVERLVRDGVPVYCMSRRHDGAFDHLGGGVKVLRVEKYSRGELEAALHGLRPGVVYNLASYGVRPDDRDTDQMLAGNLEVATSLLHAAATCRATLFVQAGSCSEYAPAADDRLLDEDHPVAPVSLYGAAKAAATIYGDALARRLAIEFVALRLFGVYGPGEAPYRLLPYLMDRLERDEPVDLTAGEQVRDLLYIDDVVDALLLAPRLAASGRRTCNVCSSAPVRIRTVAESACEALGKPAALLRFGERPYRPDEAMRIVGDNRRFCAATGWQPAVELKEGVRRMVVARRQRAFGRA